MAAELTSPVRRAARVTGVVQGVGYRPAVHALATSLGLAGHVGNDAQGVFVEVEGSPAAVDALIDGLRSQAPPLAVVEEVVVRDLDPVGETGFTIVGSRDGEAGTVALIPPDTAVCAQCVAEVDDPGDRRHRYPFTACTYCGPRYTIVTGLPYDRPFTTMAAFPMCPRCTREYEDPSDRRFHAQPTACPDCGPRLRFHDPHTHRTELADKALAAAQEALVAGRIVAVKGVGGYHLACDAGDPAAVGRLRERKQRGDKPFAVMARDLPAAAALVELDERERALLTSPQAPIVLAAARLDDEAARAVHDSVAPRNGRVGVLLPYSPLHHLLMAPHPDRPGLPVPTLLVMTSGNLSDEPLAIDPDEAERRLAAIADAFLHHDRGIHVSCDDSVVRLVDGDVQPVRRSRGYAPLPVRLPLAAPASLAVGGELKTTICVAEGTRAWMSQHIGDTANLETLDLLARTSRTLCDLTRVRPELVAADLHPGYLSRRWAADHAAAAGIPLVLVQHHHAHLGALLAEHGVAPGTPVLGFTFDGTGYGTDATIWGGELLLGSYDAVERVGHLAPVALPGGDAAIRRPARSALSHLRAAGVAWTDDLPPVAAADDVERRVVGRMLDTGTGCTPTTSVGRLFDAVAALLGVRQDVDYEGQAAIELEALAATVAPGPGDPAWRVEVRDEAGAPVVLDPAPALRAGAAAVRSGVATAAAARAFHEALADAVTGAAAVVRARTGVATVGLTGGVFSNALLTTACRGRLEAAGFTVLVHRVVPPNDGGLALGQVAVAASGGGSPAGGG